MYWYGPKRWAGFRCRGIVWPWSDVSRGDALMSELKIRLLEKTLKLQEQKRRAFLAAKNKQEAGRVEVRMEHTRRLLDDLRSR
jgi:hypothetical protein